MKTFITVTVFLHHITVFLHLITLLCYNIVKQLNTALFYIHKLTDTDEWLLSL